MHSTKAVAVGPKEVAVPFAGDSLSESIRTVIRDAIVRIASEELTACLGASGYERTAVRKGYRNGAKPRTLTTSLGKTEFLLPRARLNIDGKQVEWQSSVIPRYVRRTREVDAAMLGLYFGGVNTRKVQLALRPILRDAPMSKSSLSRLVVGLKGYFEAWNSRPLKQEDIRYLYLDGTYIKVRVAGRSSSLAILAAIGVRSTGEKVLLSLRTMGSESAASWESFMDDLVARGLRMPELAVVDGSSGLTAALERLWPGMPRQRCAVHKLRNILGHAPKRLHEEIRADFHAITYAESAAAARSAYEAFLRKWKRLSESVVRSMEEAGEDLLTFTRFPQEQWKAIRTTNIIERLNQEFRRRTKTQGMFPTESSILILMFGLVASGMVKLRRIGGYETMGTGLRRPSTEGVPVLAGKE